MNMNARKTFLHRLNTKTFVFMTGVAMVAMAALSLLLVPNFNSASAQEAGEAQNVERATPEMIAYALNFKTGMADGIAAINQLPCETVNESELAGKTFTPGVYCLSSARLAGQMTLDGGSDKAGVFIFRVDGKLNVASGSTLELINGAQGSNVFFVANDSATIGENATFRANILSKKEVTVEDGALINRAQSLEDKVTMSDSASLGGGTGTLEICKALDPSSVDISNRVFNFTISGVAANEPGGVGNPLRVPVGSCSAPIDVPTGIQTITELNTGQTLTGGTFTGGFQLNRVDNLIPNSTSTVNFVNLALRTANVNIVEGGVGTQLTLRFVNQFAITGFVEICKFASTGPGASNPAPVGDPDVTGFFDFNIEGVFTTAANGTRTLTNFAVPVGQCTGHIAVTIANPPPTGSPLQSTVRISELGRPGFFLESVDTFPANRLLAFAPGQRIDENGNAVSNPGGGFATVTIVQGTAPGNQTLINFRNRSNPSLLKVCKIAGPGVPVNTLYRFTITGFGPTNAAPPQFATYGAVTRIVDVRAGAANQGGNCTFVPGFGGGAGFAEFQTFVNGTVVTVNETGVSPLNTIPQPTGQVVTSRIRVSDNSRFATEAEAGFSPNPDLTPDAGRISRAAVIARANVVEVDFTNILVTPATIKLCKVAGNAATVGQPFNFNVTVGTVGGLVPSTFSQNLTIQAGPVGGNGTGAGYCTILQGPLAATPFNSFNANLPIIITETVPTGTTTTVTTPTGPTTGVTTTTTAITRTATVTISNTVGSTFINEVIFTNTLPAVVTPTPTPVGTRAAAFDFDGDNKADLSTFTPATGTWNVMRSSTGVASSTQFGANGDVIAPADYDGDGKVDMAVFRNGAWYLLQSTNGFASYSFGQAGDIAQPGYYDNDAKADIAVFRPSNGGWYILGSQDGFRAVQFGMNGDRPVAADYDGDGVTDPAVYRNGSWYLLRSTAGFAGVNWGNATDRAIPADFDGDGKANLAVFRAGVWYILKADMTNFDIKYFGIESDRPVAADYTGDGKADIAVYRNGNWYISNTSDFLSYEFGGANDLPVPSAYVQ